MVNKDVNDHQLDKLIRTAASNKNRDKTTTIDRVHIRKSSINEAAIN